MSRSKKLGAGLLVLALLIGSSFIAKEIKANASPEVRTLLVNGILNPWNFKLVILDMASSTEPTHYTLPSTTNNDGDIYVIKLINDDENGAVIDPAEGDTINLNDAYYTLYGAGGRSLQLAADADRNTWHVIGGNWQ